MSASLALSDEQMVDQAFAEAARLKAARSHDFGSVTSTGRRDPRPWHQRLGAAPATRRSRPLFALMLLALALVATLGLRRTIVAAVPETAVLYAAIGLPVNLRGFELHGIKSMIFTENGVELLIVQGEITNVTSKSQAVPPLHFSVRDARGVEIYSWVAGTDLKPLDAGGKGTFRRRLASPPQNGADVVVRFAGRP